MDLSSQEGITVFLCELEREVIQLRILGNLSVGEIAIKMKLKRRSIEKLLENALRKITTTLNQTESRTWGKETNET